jgi:hypothetical protein
MLIPDLNVFGTEVSGPIMVLLTYDLGVVGNIQYLLMVIGLLPHSAKWKYNTDLFQKKEKERQRKYSTFLAISKVKGRNSQRIRSAASAKIRIL